MYVLLIQMYQPSRDGGISAHSHEFRTHEAALEASEKIKERWECGSFGGPRISTIIVKDPQ